MYDFAPIDRALTFAEELSIKVSDRRTEEEVKGFNILVLKWFFWAVF